MPQLGVNEVFLQLERLDPWPSGRNYSRRSWQKLIDLAVRAQQIPEEQFAELLGKFLGDSPSLEKEGKVFLLLRLIFDTSQLPPVPPPYQGPAWIPDDLDRSARAKPFEWPIIWVNGKPQLVSGLGGARHRKYDAVAEYRFFAAHCPLRYLIETSRDNER